jgi:hypothetical protein
MLSRSYCNDDRRELLKIMLEMEMMEMWRKLGVDDGVTPHREPRDEIYVQSNCCLSTKNDRSYTHPVIGCGTAGPCLALRGRMQKHALSTSEHGQKQRCFTHLAKRIHNVATFPCKDGRGATGFREQLDLHVDPRTPELLRFLQHASSVSPHATG